MHETPCICRTRVMSDAEEWWDAETSARHCGVSVSRFRVLATEHQLTSRREKRRIDPDAPTRRGSPITEYPANEVRDVKAKRDASPGRGNWGKGREPTGGWLARTKKEGE